MRPDVNSMMREQLYKDGYILCYSGMKIRRSTSYPIDLVLSKHRPIFSIEDDGTVAAIRQGIYHRREG